MRVLHVINDLRFAGAERLVADLAPRQQAEGTSVSVAALAAAQTDMESDLRQAGISLFLPERPIRFLSPAHVARLASLFAEADLVHVHLFPAQLWAVLAAKSLGKRAPRLVTTEHNTHNRRREKPYLKPLDRWMYRGYDAVVAISDATKAAMTAYLPETEAKTVVIPNGVDLSRFTVTGSAAERATLFPELGKTDMVLLSVGRLTEQKGMDVLVEAMRDLPNVHLYIVGEGDLRGALQAQVKNSGSANHVHFLGNRGDIPALLRNADIYAQASRWEGFGIAAVEAMASGLPVVAADVPGLREVVGEAGIRVPAGDVSALYESLKILVSDVLQRRSLGMMAKERASAFAIDASVQAHLSLYRELMQKTG